MRFQELKISTLTGCDFNSRRSWYRAAFGIVSKLQYFRNKVFPTIIQLCQAHCFREGRSSCEDLHTIAMGNINFLSSVETFSSWGFGRCMEFSPPARILTWHPGNKQIWPPNKVDATVWKPLRNFYSMPALTSQRLTIGVARLSPFLKWYFDIFKIGPTVQSDFKINIIWY